MLVVLQSLDAAGKDGTILSRDERCQPAGRVGAQSSRSRRPRSSHHDFLWRYARSFPAAGEIGIFNRSHYEEVLVVRVHPHFLVKQRLPDAVDEDGVDDSIWKRRFREINHWERYLVDNGFRIVKLFLNLSKDEQRKRFLLAYRRAGENWKFLANDIHERQYWDDYQHAFSDMLSHTSTESAPWHVIPADHKWFAARSRPRQFSPRHSSTSIHSFPRWTTRRVRRFRPRRRRSKRKEKHLDRDIHDGVRRVPRGKPAGKPRASACRARRMRAGNRSPTGQTQLTLARTRGHTCPGASWRYATSACSHRRSRSIAGRR